MGTLRTRVPQKVPGLIETTKGKSLTRQPPDEMARHRCVRLLVRRTTLTCGVYRRKQRERQPIPSRTPLLHRHRSNETPTPYRIRGDEAQGYRCHQIEPDHPKHVWQSKQPERLQRGKLAK